MVDYTNLFSNTKPDLHYVPRINSRAKCFIVFSFYMLLVSICKLLNYYVSVNKGQWFVVFLCFSGFDIRLILAL